jgi:hypothetical protein
MAPTPEQVKLIRDYEPALFFFGRPGGAGAERFFPSDAKRYLEHCALWRARAPFLTRSDWGAPVVAAGKLGAIDGEADVFLGKRNSSGVPEYLDTPSDQECFLEMSGWKSADHDADLDRLAARYASETEPELKKSQFWYHAEFFDAARLRRLFGDAVDPGGSVIDFNRLFEPRPDKPPVLTDPALICYYLFYPGHEESLAGCIDPETGLLYEKARDFGSFAGEWSCIALLLERTGSSAAYVPKWAGLSNRNVGVINVGGREVRSSMRILPWSAMQVFEGTHPRFAVAKGSHALYLPGETPPPLMSDDPSAAFCGSATPLVDPGDQTGISPVAGEIVLSKLIAGAAAGGWLGPVGVAIGAAGGLVWGIAEIAAPHITHISLGIPSGEPTVDAISPGGLVVHPKGKRPAEVDESRAVEWQCDDNVLINGRRYHFTVDRETQVLWGTDPDGLGYTGRWGPRVEEDAQTRRAGMKFPKFWRLFFDELVRNDPPSRTIVLTRDAGTTWPVPADWNNANNTIQCIGGGGGGVDGAVAVIGAGGSGGGGAYSSTANLSLTQGSVVTYQVGAGGNRAAAGGAAGAGTDSYFNGTSLAASSVGAKGGAGANGTIGGGGGDAAGGVGTTKFSGGNGANGGPGNNGGPGGGGTAGPKGAGGAGSVSTSAQFGGGGGGGNGGGAAGAVGASADAGNNGGNNSSGAGGAGGGAAQGAGGAGTAGGGGGGGGGNSAGGGTCGAGGAGGAGADDGSGGGGGGGGGGGTASTGGAGGDGGLYGGGGGGGGFVVSGAAGQGGNGANGLIVVSYTP